MAENNFSTDYANLRLLHTSRYGNSRVFTANYNGKKVIVKTLKEECVDDAACKASLRQEYETTSMLDNKYVRKALDFVKIEGMGDCIIFEFVEGKSLAEHVRVGTLSEKQVKSILTEVCDGLNFLHRNGIVHGNLNPENIMVSTTDYRVKLIDIGVPETKQDADRELLIKEMEFVAPEIIKGEDYDTRADVYSLGKIMEFIGQRNITKQFHNAATHCTQFSKEQRFDTISEVRTAITSGQSFVKIIVLAVVAALVVALAIVYVPKIKANVEKERAERRVVEFNREVEKIRAELPELCKKYELKSLSDPVELDWSEDSMRYAGKLEQYLGHDESLFGLEDVGSKYRRVFADQRKGIEESRQADFEQLLLNEFKSTNDSIAVAMRKGLTEPTDDALLIEAMKWYGQRQ